MNKKIFENSRICPKGDIEANWNKAVGFIPLDKEIIIYKADSAHPAARFKVGDGKTVVQDLPFSGTDIEAIEKLIDEKGELLIEYVDNAVAAIAQSDWEQNNENAEDFIKNKPFYYNEEELAYWDGMTPLDRIRISLQGSFSQVEPSVSSYVKVSNDIILKDRFILATIDGNLVDSSKLYEYNGCYGYDMKRYSTELGRPIPGFGYYYVDMPALIIVMEDGIDISQCLTIYEPVAAKFKIDNPLLSKGIYALGSYQNETKIDIITLKQIDEKFIPKSIVNQEFDPQSEKAQSGIAIAKHFSEGMSAIGEAFQYIDDIKLDKTGGTITGDLSISGDLIVSGTTTTQDTETVLVKNNIVVTNSDGLELLETGGFAIKTNATEAYGIMYDPIGKGVKIGLGGFDENGKFVYGDLDILNPDYTPGVIVGGQAQFLATRADSIGGGNIPEWDNERNQFIDSGKKADDCVEYSAFGQPFKIQRDVDGTRYIALESPTGALQSRVETFPILGGTMDFAWKQCAIDNRETWESEDYEKFYTFIGAVKDYHTNRDGIARFNDGRLNVTDASTADGALVSGANVINARTLLRELDNATTEVKGYTDKKVSTERAEIDASIDSAKTKTRYGTYTNAYHYPLAIGGWYMAFSSDSSLKICKADGTEVVSGARQMLFMSVPYSETEKEKFVVMGMYFYDGTFSITNPKVPMEFIQIQVDKGSYITADSSATFNVSVRGENL